MDLHSHAIVLDVLQQASSQNPDILKPAEEKLKQWEVHPGFYSILFSVMSNGSIDVNVRWMAVLYMKNGVDKYWRRAVPNAISEEEKHNIRREIISVFNEAVSQIAVQRAVLISKIARMDWPKEWPELFPTLLQAIESTDCFVQHRALLTLHHVVKAISSKRLAGDRRIFQDFTKSIYVFILNLWNNFTQAFQSDIMSGAAPDIITSNLEKALLTLRILRKLSVFGFYMPHENQDCMSFMEIIFDKCKTSLQCRSQLRGKGEYLIELCEKFVIHLTKVLLSLLDMHPFSFIRLINPSLEFTVYYLFTEEGINYVFERFVIQCFNLIKKILLCAEFKVTKIPSFNKQIDVAKANEIKQNFFQPQVLTDICRKMVTHYFILKSEELEMWDADPETFANDECGDSWKYSLRPSMETVFVTIFHEYKDLLTPVMLEMIGSTNCLVSPDDMQGILRKDAVYNAVSLCAFDLYDEVDFDQWFTNTLIQELKIKHNNYRVIRRSVTELIGKWTGMKLSSELRPTLYECILSLLAPDEDMAVRLSATTTLRYAIDDFEFNCDQFKDYLYTSFDMLFSLLREASECDTKMKVLNVMTIMLERMGQTIQPHSDAMINYLPHLWQESEEHNMLRCAIVSTLVQLVKALGVVKPELYPFLLPIIELGTDTKQGAIVYLLEDSLDLWLAVLENSTTMTYELMQLFNNMPALLDYSTENLRHCLIISLAHMLLDPELVMRTNGSQIISVCDSLMGDLKNEGIVVLMRLVETYIRAAPQLGSETVLPILPRIFQKIYEGEEYPMIMTMYLCVLSRILLSTHSVFTKVLATLAQVHNDTDHAILSKILDVWLNKMANVSQLDQRKLLGLALTNLLTTQSRPVLERFPKIMVNILETLNDITKSDDGGALTDCLVLTEGRSPSYFNEDSDGYYETDHDQRKKLLILSDPVHTIVLKDYLQSQMCELRNQLGLEDYQSLVQTIDTDTISQLNDYISF